MAQLSLRIAPALYSVKSQRPYAVKHVEGKWTIKGRLPAGMVGGTFHVVIRQETHKSWRLAMELELKTSNQPMKPTAPLRHNFNVFATDPDRGLSLSRWAAEGS